MWRWYDKLSDLDEALWIKCVLEQSRPSPFLTPAFLKPWAASFAGEIRVGLWQDRGLIFFHRNETSWELLGGQDVADRLDGLCPEPEFWNSLRSEIAEWDAPLVFPNLAPDADALCYRLPQDTLETTDDSPYVPLEGDFANYLLALPRKARHELKRKMAKADREAANGLVLDSGFHNLETFLHLHRLSTPDKASFMQEKMEGFFRTLCRSFDEAGMLRLWTLSDGSLSIASVVEIRFAGVAHLYNSGYDPSQSHLSPGLTLIARCIEQACLDGLREYDFLRGEERYKYHLGGLHRAVHRLTWL